jgi:DNA-binding NtrC family response regulator
MTSLGRVLVVDDEASIRAILKIALAKVASEVVVAESAEAGLQQLQQSLFDVVVSDIRMPGMDGLEFLRLVRLEQPEVRFLLITAHASVETAVEALRAGASDFLVKPFDNDQVRTVVARLLAQQPPRTLPPSEGVVGESPVFLAALDTARRAAPSDVTVLITGESGTGKEVIAQWIHRQSRRCEGPLIAVNCGAIPENLIEAELFGYEKGAFTGAHSSKPGRFELANGGTLFLDEVGEMPAPLQVKILRVLQERRVDRLGGSATRSVDFRLITATNRDLNAEMRAGRFREDLFFRLAVIPLHLPPLRKRGADVLLLAQYLLQKLNVRYETQHAISSTEASALQAYEWPGNVRELENRLERAVVLGGSEGLALDLPREEAGSETTSLLRAGKSEAEEQLIRKVLAEQEGNRTRAAKALGISRRSLLYKIKAFGLD